MNMQRLLSRSLLLSSFLIISACGSGGGGGGGGGSSAPSTVTPESLETSPLEGEVTRLFNFLYPQAYAQTSNACLSTCSQSSCASLYFFNNDGTLPDSPICSTNIYGSPAKYTYSFSVKKGALIGKKYLIKIVLPDNSIREVVARISTNPEKVTVTPESTLMAQFLKTKNADDSFQFGSEDLQKILILLTKSNVINNTTGPTLKDLLSSKSIKFIDFIEQHSSTLKDHALNYSNPNDIKPLVTSEITDFRSGAVLQISKTQDSDGDGKSDFEDCDDASATTWRLLTYSYVDRDQDGFTKAEAGTICVGNQTPGYIKSFTSGSDCDDENPTKNRLLDGYLDADKDGWGVGNIIKVCSGNKLPEGYVASKSVDDCDDIDPSKQKTLINPTSDKDGDGYHTNQQSVLCVANNSELPQLPSKGLDCNDNDSQLASPIIGYKDYDGDGYGGQFSEPLCTKSLPSGYVSDNTDCADNNANLYNLIYDVIYKSDTNTLHRGNLCAGLTPPTYFPPSFSLQAFAEPNTVTPQINGYSYSGGAPNFVPTLWRINDSTNLRDAFYPLGNIQQKCGSGVVISDFNAENLVIGTDCKVILYDTQSSNFTLIDSAGSPESNINPFTLMSTDGKSMTVSYTPRYGEQRIKNYYLNNSGTWTSGKELSYAWATNYTNQKRFLSLDGRFAVYVAGFYRSNIMLYDFKANKYVELSAPRDPNYYYQEVYFSPSEEKIHLVLASIFSGGPIKKYTIQNPARLLD